jgi:hypothetical protein
MPDTGTRDEPAHHKVTGLTLSLLYPRVATSRPNLISPDLDDRLSDDP